MKLGRLNSDFVPAVAIVALAAAITLVLGVASTAQTAGDLPGKPPAAVDKHLQLTPTARLAASPTPVPAAPLGPLAIGSRLNYRQPQPDGSVAFGLYTPAVPNNLASVASLEDTIGKQAAILMWYAHWSGPGSAFLREPIDAVTAHGSVPLITWLSYDESSGVDPRDQSNYSNQRVLRGDYDAYIQSWADGVRDSHTTVLIRFDPEMNGNWYPWAAGVNGNSAATYVAMWRHVHDIFFREGATNVSWVWSPNVDFTGATPLESMYPGDAYVDWLGLDGYNWGMTNGYTPWHSFTDVFGPSYARLTRLSQKAILIGEMSSVETGAPAGQSKAEWISSALGVEIPSRFPRLRAFVWFDQDNGGQRDWRVDSSPDSLAAFRAAIAARTYSSTFQAS